MKKNSHSDPTTAEQALNILWMLLTISFLTVALYYQWKHNQSKTHHKVQVIADQTRAKLDDLIERLLTSAYSLPLYGRELPSCQKELLPLLQTMTFNNPLISGLVIRNENNEIICSTLAENYSLPSFTNEGPTLFGPLKMDQLKENVFLLQQKLGHYYLGIYVLEKLIQNVLNSVPPEIVYAGLFNTKAKEIVLQYGKDPLATSQPALYMAEAPLQHLDNFKVILVGDRKQFRKYSIFHIVIATLFVFFISFLLYIHLRRILNRRFSLTHALNNAIRHHDFQPLYQPIIDISKNTYCGAEILLRWQTEMKQVMPEFFIDEAEQSGLIIPITLQVLEKALQESQELLKTHPDFHLALNVSAIHFSHPNFFTEFFNLCERYKIKPQQLMIELTERQLLDQDNEELIAKMHELRNRGHFLAIDDFGTGHASIKYLQHFPFSHLKIDKIFIHAIGTGAITEYLNKSIIHMANSLQLEIIAEGVETKEQVTFLQQYKVKLMQGWYFEKAVAFDQLVKIMGGNKENE
ncbi:Rtn protein [Legionella lansingensis]|uniref:Rtn protein n=1 Tax=Legionella lansingensis TaxID=45067 RepID=A0A0W0VTC2_9GAMM|nr:EAL domain-containing protein [Legionella lansingensis]KTD23440.1 Rtn protein [Legionella lansingensis]SNV50899.1 Rtn protein [Legionella lansingensis]